MIWFLQRPFVRVHSRGMLFFPLADLPFRFVVFASRSSSRPLARGSAIAMHFFARGRNAVMLDITLFRKSTKGRSGPRWFGALCCAISSVAASALLHSVVRAVNIQSPGELLCALFTLSLFLSNAVGAARGSPHRCSSETKTTWSVQSRHTPSCRIPKLVHRAGDASGDQR